MPSTVEIGKRLLTRASGRIYSLPVLVLMPHSRCNCRCVMCDIWRANQQGQELGLEVLERHGESFRRLGVRWVVLSGGEALMHSNLWALCALLKPLPAKITLLSTGLLLARHADAIAQWCDEVIVSLDGSREVHDAIRNVPRAFERMAEGVAALRERRPQLRIAARCVLQRANYADLPGIIAAAHALGLDQLSFLAADVSSSAFNRPTPWDDQRVADVALSPDQTDEFSRILEQTIAQHAGDFASGFIAESPAKLRRLPRYYAAINGQGEFPQTSCNAPWVSTVVEADGTVRPCFFHLALGNINQQPLEEILNGEQAVAFRRQLDVREDPICKKCVCSLKLSARALP